jgi:hypothetical protein
MGVVVALVVSMFKIGHNEYYIQYNLINPIASNSLTSQSLINFNMSNISHHFSSARPFPENLEKVDNYPRAI